LLPSLLAASNLPPELKQHAISHVSECLTMDLDQEQAQMLQGLLIQLQQSKFNPNAWHHTETFNSELDKIRGQNHLELYEKETFINQ
jgi:hypothetical protein